MHPISPPSRPQYRHFRRIRPPLRQSELDAQSARDRELCAHDRELVNAAQLEHQSGPPMASDTGTRARHDDTSVAAAHSVPAAR